MADIVKLIYESIKEDIIELNLLPGTKIKEEDLAIKYKTSRTPVRSAIARLVEDELLVVVSQKGTYVSKIDTNYLKDYLFIRSSVEADIVREAAKRATDEDLQVVNSILAEQQELAKLSPSVEKSKLFYQNDNRFHKALYKIAGKESVWSIIYETSTVINRVRIMANMRNASDVEKVYEQHYDVYKYLKLHEVEKAVNAMISHFEEGFEGINAVIAKYNDFFK